MESEYFVNLLRILNPEYSPPTRKTLSGSLLNQEYDEFCNSLRKEETDNGVLLLDGWKNSVANTKNVVAITRTISGQNVFLESSLLEALSIVVNQCIDLAMQKCNINIYAVVTDNASNMISMGRQVNVWHTIYNSHSGNLLFKTLSDIEFDKNITNIVKDFKTPMLESQLMNAGGKKMILPGGTR